MLFVRALIAFLVCPGIVAFTIPLVSIWYLGTPVIWWPGGVVALIGLSILLRCVVDFYQAGKGTLAPWHPPRNIVIVGLYRHVRNPMYVGVLILVTGWALLFQTWQVAVYAAGLWVMFHTHVMLYEEPWLKKQFPETFAEYRSHVRRWLPQFAPWTPGG